MNIVQNLADEVKWRYMTGSINKITPDTVIDVAKDIYPNSDCDWENSDQIFQAMMQIKK